MDESHRTQTDQMICLKLAFVFVESDGGSR